MLDCPNLSTSLFDTLDARMLADFPVRGPKEPRMAHHSSTNDNLNSHYKAKLTFKEFTSC